MYAWHILHWLSDMRMIRHNGQISSLRSHLACAKHR